MVGGGLNRMKKPADSKYTINPEIASREIKGQLLFLRPGDRALYTTNATGQFIWRQLVRKTQASKIVVKFAQEFGVTEEIAARDVKKFLAELERKQIILRATDR